MLSLRLAALVALSLTFSSLPACSSDDSSPGGSTGGSGGSGSTGGSGGSGSTGQPTSCASRCQAYATQCNQAPGQCSAVCASITEKELHCLETSSCDEDTYNTCVDQPSPAGGGGTSGAAGSTSNGGTGNEAGTSSSGGTSGGAAGTSSGDGCPSLMWPSPSTPACVKLPQSSTSSACTAAGLPADAPGYDCCKARGTPPASAVCTKTGSNSKVDTYCCQSAF